MRAARASFAAVAAAVLLAGCSSVRLAYDHAQAFLRWRANAYLDLHGPEAKELDERIALFLDWHRAKALPRYARLSEEAAQRLGDGLSREDLNWGYDALMLHAREGLRAAATQIAPLLDQLDAGQIAYLERRLAEDNRKFARENLQGSEADRRQLRARRMQDRLEEWVGKLTREQVERVKLYAERAPLTDAQRDRDRERLQKELVAMVRKHEARKRLPDLAAQWQQGRDPAYVAANEAWRQEFYALLLDIDRTLTSAQRERAMANFRRYAQDFTVLASRGGAMPSRTQ
jgi:uncharacterized protein DUF6279